MRKRNIRIQVWVNQTEHDKLQLYAKKTGLTKEALVRSLIEGYEPKAFPPMDFFTLFRELHAIGNNLNQLAYRANATGHLDAVVFQVEADRLRRAVQDIYREVTVPKRRTGEGRE